MLISREKGPFHIQNHRTCRPVLTNGKRPVSPSQPFSVSSHNAPSETSPERNPRLGVYEKVGVSGVGV